MKKNITIVGVGERKAGTGKTGKPYAFTPIAFTYEDDYFVGVKASTANVDDGTLDGYRPAVGDAVQAFIRPDFKTGRVYVDGFVF